MVNINDKKTIQDVRNHLRTIRNNASIDTPIKEVRLVTSLWVSACIQKNYCIIPESDGLHSPSPETKFDDH